jgi:alcohol dehydrogenase class IV
LRGGQNMSVRVCVTTRKGQRVLASFNIPATVILGEGASQEIANQVGRLQGRRALLVTDAHLLRSGVAEGALQRLRAGGIETAVYSGVQPDPTVRNVMEGLDELRRSRAEIVIGFGGGSSIDAAKAIAILATNPPPISQYAGYHRIGRPGLPLIAVPTTAGTGSEVSKAAVITDTDRDVKMMMFDVHLLPLVALVDYELTLTMPPALTAHVGVDTLTHGIEAYVSRRANELSDACALACIRQVASHLRTAFADPESRPAREGMMAAACQAGMAFSNSSVCLVHGMSRPIGAHFHVPHGLSNAVLLPDVTRFSQPAAVERYAAVARVMGIAGEAASDTRAGEALISYLVELNHALGIGRLRDVIPGGRAALEPKLSAMADAALESGSPQNNPRVPTKEEIIQIYEEAW